MAQLTGLSGLGGPIDYMQLVPDFRGEALKTSQANAMDVQSQARQQEMANQQRQDARQQAFYGALSTATPEQLPALRQQFPEFAQNIQQEIGIQDEDHAKYVNKSLGRLSVALASGDPNQISQVVQSSAPVWGSLGTSSEEIMKLVQSDPGRAMDLAKAAYMTTLPYDKQANIKSDEAKLAEAIRSNKAGEGLQTMQIAQSRENSIRSASGQNSQPASVKEYQYFQSLSPEQQQTYMRVRGRPDVGGGNNTVQLADGRIARVTGKLHGSGASAFYEGVDDAGNMVRVPASAISAPPTSAASAQNFGMSKDLDAIESASPDNLGFMTGVTGSSGSPAIGADVRSRISGKDQRQLYNSAQRIQGKMQNQGIAAARDMGASGINTVAEAKMYFQGMPQIDFSSPESMQQSVKDIRQYTDTYNQQYQVNVGGQQRSQQPSQQQTSGYSSLWGD